MKTINEEQIKIIMDELMALNIPIKSFAGIQSLLANLPIIKKDEPTITE